MATTGLFASLTRLGGTLVGIAQTRLALLATDAEEARLQLLSLLALAAVAALGIGVGVVLGSIALVIGFWDTYGRLRSTPVAACFLLAYLGYFGHTNPTCIPRPTGLGCMRGSGAVSWPSSSSC